MSVENRILEGVAQTIREHLPKEGSRMLFGYELELPVVDGDLHPASAEPILQHLKECDEAHKDVMYEFGKCILEIGIAPSENLFELKNRVDAKLHSLAEIADSFDLYLLGYGGHPIGKPTLQQWRLKTPRYDILEKVLPPGIEWFLRIASEQTHIALPEEKLVRGLTLINTLAPLLRAVCANSSFLGDHPTQSWIGRDQAYAQLPDDRIGCQGPFSSLEEYLDWLLRREMYFYLDESGGIVDSHKDHLSGYAVISREQDIDIECCISREDRENVFSRFVKPLMTTLWPEARLSRHFTLEARFACAPPPFDTLASSALTVGILRNMEELEGFARRLVEVDGWSIPDKRLEVARNPDRFLFQIQEMVSLSKKLLTEGERQVFEPILGRFSGTSLHLPASRAQCMLGHNQTEHFLNSFAYRSISYS
jgi:gamma-glutamylcysteine synthetase